MKKILFLDRDGVINKDVSYLCSTEQIQWQEGIVEGLLYAQEKGYEFIIVTNQSAIARGLCTEEDVLHIHEYMKNYLKEKGITILDIFYCPHLQEGIVEEYAIDCNCRKPKSGLIEQACATYDIDRSFSLLIGDNERDVLAAEGASIKGYLFNDQKSTIEEYIKDVIQ